MNRRDFLKAAPVAASAMGTLASSARVSAAPTPEGAPPRIGGQTYTPVPDYPIQPKPSFEVTIADTFWQPKISTNATVTIPFEVRKLNETPRGFRGNVLEAAIVSLETHPDPSLQAQVDARIAQILDEPDREADAGPDSSLDHTRPSVSNTGFEVAVAYYTATGKRSLLDKAIRAADALYQDFASNNPPFSGGERDAINCVQLYRVTHDKKHLDLAKHYLDIRGLENSVNRSRHNQSYKPVLEQSEAVGHAVNCMSLMVSLADVGVLTGLDAYLKTAQRVWADAVERKMYITGGVGTTGNEGFGEPYSLPNISAYSETCAVLMFITLNHRLFMATGDSKYIDVMERGMYNNAIDGVSATGQRFFYVNRLASAGDGRDLRWERASLECCPPNLVRFLAGMPGLVYARAGVGPHEQLENGDELRRARDVIYVNLYVSSRATFKIGEREITLAMDSQMPWGGKSTIAVTAKRPVKSTIRLRIPGWARNRAVPGNLYRYLARVDKPVALTINGRSESAVPDEMGYVALDREWQDGDVMAIEFPLEIRKVLANDRVVENRRRVAIERGPIVYCAEWLDIEAGGAAAGAPSAVRRDGVEAAGAPSAVRRDGVEAAGVAAARPEDLGVGPQAVSNNRLHVLELLLDPRYALTAAAGQTIVDSAGPVTVIHGTARAINRGSQPSVPFRMIPYYLWANRGAGEMSVWLSTSGYAIGDVGPAGGIIFYENPNHEADGWRYLEAAPFDQSAGAKWGCFRRAIGGARETRLGAGRQNTFDMLSACPEPGTAAELCAHLTLNGVGGWFLPSRDELALMYRNLVAAGLGDFRDGGAPDNFTYWTSSQQTADMAAHIDFADLGRQHSDDKDFPRRVRAIRAI